MKLRVFDRVVMTVLMLFCIGVGAVALGFAWNLFSFPVLGYMLLEVKLSLLWQILITVIALVWIVLCFKVIFSVPKAPRERHALIKKSDDGAILISLQAIEAIATKYATSMVEVREMKPHTALQEGGIAMRIQVSFKPDIDIPAISTQLQGGIKEAIEQQAGVPVREIRLLVETPSNKSLAPV
ncbi:alkaline shock response membrane anchor protein AmaP [Luoshenia tenuis]|jgi:hypothetical protein|uniref:alkaline shock response membrane anchor protein AmaP n=1 Tax=Luoshenia tenuis TaxID=2763654 RepID=UPI003D8B767E